MPREACLEARPRDADRDCMVFTILVSARHDASIRLAWQGLLPAVRTPGAGVFSAPRPRSLLCDTRHCENRFSHGIFPASLRPSLGRIHESVATTKGPHAIPPERPRPPPAGAPLPHDPCADQPAAGKRSSPCQEATKNSGIILPYGSSRRPACSWPCSGCCSIRTSNTGRRSTTTANACGRSIWRNPCPSNSAGCSTTSSI